MQEIAHNVFIENAYPGVTLGAISLPRGLILIDAPPRFEDGRAWRAALQNLGEGERLLVNLDSHYDRTLGVRAMECTVAAHEKTSLVFRSRPVTFKAQPGESGADWEQLVGLGSVRWAPPELTFSDRIVIHWDGDPVILESHPGPNPGAIWVLYPSEKTAFIGDAVTPGQPPFLGSADLPAWISSLEALLEPEFRGWSLVGGRTIKLITPEQVRRQRAYLEEVQARTAPLTDQKTAPETLEAAVQALLAASSAPAAKREQYTQRLRWGLTHYLSRKHKTPSNEEE
jgi:glyoxylase-like metal-dependent hydrolase (beta-lactamase superfamily II)